MKRKRCKNCRYYRRPRSIEPCSSCHALNNWEEKPKLPKHKELRFKGSGKKEGICNNCGDDLVSKDGKDRRGLKNKDLCWICDMTENPDAYV